MIGRLERVPIREVWQYEIQFSNWLVDNIDVLGDALDFQILNPEREKSAGSFSADIYAEDDIGNSVIIENQFGKSDHDHLGKIITYLSAFESKKGIWIVEEPRPEHIQAINYLNESASEDFYLIQLEAVKIGDSPNAPLLTKIIGPSEEIKRIGGIKKERSKEDELIYSFWDELLNKMKQKSDLFSTKNPEKYPSLWIKRDSAYGYMFRTRKTDVDVIFYIEIQKSLEKSTECFKKFLEKNKNSIESAFGEELIVDFKENKKFNSLKKKITIGGYMDETKREELQNEMIDTMIRLDNAIRPHLKDINKFINTMDNE